MDGTYKTGDLIVTRKQDTYATGDIVTFQVENGAQVIDRIIGGDGSTATPHRGTATRSRSLAPHRRRHRRHLVAPVRWRRLDDAPPTQALVRRPDGRLVADERRQILVSLGGDGDDLADGGDGADVLDAGTDAGDTCVEGTTDEVVACGPVADVPTDTPSESGAGHEVPGKEEVASGPAHESPSPEAANEEAVVAAQDEPAGESAQDAPGGGSDEATPAG